jgi:protein-disulfide isomerase
MTEWVEAVYENQDSLGLRPWPAFAEDSGVGALAQFEACLGEASVSEAVDRGKELGDRIGVTAVPTVFVNGWRFSGPPTREKLEATVEALIDGRRPR